MVTLRCNSIGSRSPTPATADGSPSTGRLGDWYVHLVRFGRPEFAFATSERSLLTVLFPARALRTALGAVEPLRLARHRKRVQNRDLIHRWIRCTPKPATEAGMRGTKRFGPRPP
jgi:hypothetical protein